jgi:hypothetical protein
MVAALPQPYSKNPLADTAMTLRFNAGGTFIVRDLRLRTAPVSGTSLDLSLRTITLSQLATSINAVAGYTATVGSGLNSVKAYTLLEGTYDGSGGISVNMPYFTSANYQALAPVAQAYDDLDVAWKEALAQADLRSAKDVWLDRFGLLYGVTRSPAEPDVSYSRRINLSVIAQKCNGRGIESILSTAMGVTATTANVPPSRFTTTIVISDTSGNPYNTATINALIDTYKTFGTINTTVLQTAASEIEPMTTYTDALSDAVAAGSGSWGAPEWATRESGT